MQSLAFRNTEFEIIDRNNQPWLRGFQIGSALGYKNPSADMSKLYDRNSDEFSDRMTALVELETAGGKQQVRIFSLRGAHLLAMLSRTKVAKDFRRWVLDVLESLSAPVAPIKPGRTTKLLPNGLTADQQDVIKALVKARVDDLPENRRAKGAITCWSALKSKFGCTYKQIAPEQFTDAVSLVARVPLDGDYLGKPAGFGDIIGRPLAPVERWMVYIDSDGREQYRAIPAGACVLTPRQFIDAMLITGEMPIATGDMFDLVMAALDKIKARSESQRRHLQRVLDLNP